MRKQNPKKKKREKKTNKKPTTVSSGLATHTKQSLMSFLLCVSGPRPRKSRFPLPCTSQQDHTSFPLGMGSFLQSAGSFAQDSGAYARSAVGSSSTQGRKENVSETVLIATVFLSISINEYTLP